MNRFLPYFLYLLVGIAFGIVLTKAEITSWYRMQEMFRFQAFHMYGVMGSAVVLGIGTVWALKKFGVKSMGGNDIKLIPKEAGTHRYVWGGLIFGVGWGIVGTCPGPMYATIGQGFLSALLIIFSALLGTLVYGLIQSRLPH